MLGDKAKIWIKRWEECKPTFKRQDLEEAVADIEALQAENETLREEYQVAKDLLELAEDGALPFSLEYLLSRRGFRCRKA